MTRSAVRLETRNRSDGGPDWLRLLGQGVFFLKVVLVVFVVDPQAADAFTLPKSAVSHAMTALLLSVVLALVVRDGRRGILWSPMHVAVLGVLIAFAIATPFAFDPNVALYGAWRRYLGLTQLLDLVVVYAATVMLLRNRADRRRLFAVCAAAAAFVIAYGLLQRAGVDVLSFKEGGTRLNPISTLGQPDILGGFTGIVLATTLAVLLLEWRALAVAGRVAIGGLAVAAIWLMFSMSVRNGVLALAAAWLAVMAIAFLGPTRSMAVRVVPLALAPIAALAIAFSPLGTRLQLATSAGDVSSQVRLEIWAASVRLFSERPLLGLGPDNFAAGYPTARAERSELLAPGQLENSTHNWFIYYATSAGIAGAAAIVALLALAARGAMRLIRSGDSAAIALVPLAAYLGQGLVDVNDIGIDWIFWVTLGLIAAASGTTLRGRQKQNAPGAAAIAVASIVAGLVVANAEQARINASEAQAISDGLVNANRGLDAVEYSRQATVFDARRAQYWSGLGTALGTAGNSSAATTAYLEAARLEPWQPIYWRNAALQRLAAGDEKAAFGYFEHATQLDPNDAQSRNLLARLAINRGDLAGAVGEGELAARLNPLDANVYEAPVQAHIALRQWADAERLLVAALAHVQTAHLHVLLGRVYLATGRSALAAAEVSTALGLDPGNAEALQLQAQLKN